jgi:protein gp37
LSQPSDETREILNWISTEISAGDLFHENLPTRYIVKVFAIACLTPWHTYQMLTKRTSRLPLVLDAQFEHDVKGCAWEMLGRMPNFNHQYLGHNVITRPWPLPNVHLGVSVENQATAGERIPHLLNAPADIRWVSYEPALEVVDFSRYLTKLDWIVIGGESGRRARPFRIEWAANTIRDCKASGVPVFMKQMGSRPIGRSEADLIWITKLNRKGSNWKIWPEEFQVRQFPRIYT